LTNIIEGSKSAFCFTRMAGRLIASAYSQILGKE